MTIIITAMTTLGMPVASVPTFATTINVEAGAVIVAADGQCSLREAIDNAGADAQVSNLDCDAGNGPDEIVLAASVYSLPDALASTGGEAGLPNVTTILTITGNGAIIERASSLACAIDGTQTSDEFRIASVNVGVTPALLTLADVTLRNGCADGGAIRAERASLTLRRVIASGNSNSAGGGAGAIGYGGGDHLVIEGSSFFDNTSGGDWGGAFGGGSGFGSGPWVIRNSTFSNNSTTGLGGIGNAGDLTIRNSLIVGNGAGGDCSDTMSGFTTFPATGDDLDRDGSCGTLAGNNFTQVTAAAVDLAPLDDWGGPTRSHLLNPGSVAIDAVTDCTLSDGSSPLGDDQRGELRPVDGDGMAPAACDIGAFEVQPDNPLPVELQSFDIAMSHLRTPRHPGSTTSKACRSGCSSSVATKAVHADGP